MTDTRIAWPLIGHEVAEASFVSAHRSGRLHHAWLIEGPSGIGKSRLVKRLAGYMLGATGTDERPQDAPTTDPVVQKLEANAHPDLRWLARFPDDKGKLKQDIPVDAIRELNKFFSLKSGLGGWRVGVIDALDELNRSGANAMLKTLEEPPSNTVLFLISHGTRPVLPTIRSRCRRLRLNKLTDDDVSRVLDLISAENAQAANELAKGRPGFGLELASAAGLSAANAARSLVKSLPKPGHAALAEAIRAASVDASSYAAFSSEILDWLAREAPTNSDYANAWLSLSRLTSETRDLNMDRAQAAAKLISGLQSAAQAG